MLQNSSTGRSTDSLRPIENVRFIGNLNGRYTLPDNKGRMKGAARVFACRVRSICPKNAIVTAPVSGEIGARVSMILQDVGLVKGHVSRYVDGGFAVEISACNSERRKLAAKINWVKRRVLHSVPDKREHKRFPPRDPRSSMISADGEAMDCFIIDVSRSGVAVSAAISPEVGTPLAIGAVVGRVVRHLEVGFAVKFISLQDADVLQSRLSVRLSDRPDSRNN